MKEFITWLKELTSGKKTWEKIAIIVITIMITTLIALTSCSTYMRVQEAEVSTSIIKSIETPNKPEPCQ